MGGALMDATQPAQPVQTTAAAEEGHPARSAKTRRRRLMITLAVLLFHVLGVLSSIHAVMTTRTAQGAIA
jgi:hypothetical protein